MAYRPLTNALTWSVSRRQAFAQCPRAYYYRYYGAWGGYSPQAPLAARMLYLLKNMTAFPLWAGTVVHGIIQDTLREFRGNRVRPELKALQEMARKRLNDGWLASLAVNRAWQEARETGEGERGFLERLGGALPKSQTLLFEHFYSVYGPDVPREQTQALRQKVFDSLEGFLSSGVLQAIAGLEDTAWGSIDLCQEFIIGELPPLKNAGSLPLKVWCAPDFSYQDREGRWHVVDWKTGQEHREELRFQLACYALFTMNTRKIPLEQLVLEGVFLNDAGRTAQYAVTRESLVNTQDQILKSAGAMRARLSDPAENLACEEDFPYAASQDSCLRCPFQLLCPRRNGRPDARVEEILEGEFP